MRYLENIIAGATLPLLTEYGNYRQTDILDESLDVVKLCDKFSYVRLNNASPVNGRKAKIVRETLPVYAFVIYDHYITVDIVMSTGAVIQNLCKKDLNWEYLKKYALRFGIWDEKGHVPDDVRALLHTKKGDMEVVDVCRGSRIGIRRGNTQARVSLDRFEKAKSYDDLAQNITVSSDTVGVDSNGVKYRMIEYHGHSRVFVEDEFGYIRSMSVEAFRRLHQRSKAFNTETGTEFRVGDVRFFLASKNRHNGTCCVITSDGYIFIDIPLELYTKALAEDKCYTEWKAIKKEDLFFNISELLY